MKILVLNSGSSSQKVSLFEIGDAFPEDPSLPAWEGRIEWNGDTAAMTVKNSEGIAKQEKLKNLARGKVGENSPEVRAATCKGLEFLGVTMDLDRNKESSLDRDISSPDSRVKVFVIRAAEDWAIAGECWKLCRCSPAPA